MQQVCRLCNKDYDDAECWTTCPHELLMPREDLERKAAAFDLLLKSPQVRFNHLTDQDAMRIQSITWDGFINLYELPGNFAPHLFVSIPERPAS